MALSKRDIQRLKTNRTAVPNKVYIEEPDRNGRSNYYIGTNDNRVRIISQDEYNNIVNPVTPIVNNITNNTGTTFVAGGDLSGTSTNQTVEKILNNTVPPDAAGSLVNDGIGNLSWVAGGAGYITGIDNTGNDVTLAVALGILTANLTSLNISQFTNDSGYITSTGITPAALTKVDDTNVTLTLGGTPATALLQATSLTLGWAGTLADGRIASATNWNTAYTNRITSLTTTGTSGAATLIANTLNIPQYQAAGTCVTSVGATSPITSSGGTTPTISTSMATNKLIGRGSGGTGVMEEITLGTGLSLSGTTLNASATSSVDYTTTFLFMGG